MRYHNPWTQFTGSAFVAEGDRSTLDDPRVAKRLTGDYALRLDIPPEPWCGPVHHATVLALSANPRWNSKDDAQHTTAHETAMLDNLSGDEPLIWFRDHLAHGSGARWYRERLLKNVLEHVPTKTVAERFALVDYFPYRSKNWRNAVEVQSQLYTFQVVRDALERGAVVVITRAKDLWLDAVPELATHLGSTVFVNSSVQQVRLSQNNTRLPDNGRDNKFGAIIESLSH